MFFLGCVVKRYLGLRSHMPISQSDFVQCKADNMARDKFLTALDQLSVVPVSSSFSKSEPYGR